MSKLTDAQRVVLQLYERAGLTTHAIGRIATWRCLLRMGLLRRSYGPGAIETEITEAGLRALKSKELSDG
jgi:hypothetical protein